MKFKVRKIRIGSEKQFFGETDFAGTKIYNGWADKMAGARVDSSPRARKETRPFFRSA